MNTIDPHNVLFNESICYKNIFYYSIDFLIILIQTHQPYLFFGTLRLYSHGEQKDTMKPGKVSAVHTE